MAGLSLEYNAKEWQVFKGLMQAFPRFNIRALAWVGENAKINLKKQLLSGQELNLKGDRNQRASDGKRLMTRRIVNNGKAVVIKSFPTNLFEHGRGLRSGATEPGKKILTVKLKAIMQADMQRILNAFDKNVLQKEVDILWK